MNTLVGELWDGVRNDAGEYLADVTPASVAAAMDFFTWREKGGFHVTGMTKKEIHIQCTDREYGAVLTQEVSLLLNQALEHRVLLSDAFSRQVPLSNSWPVVTAYYWVVFLVLGWLRLSGTVITYFPSEEISRLSQLNTSIGGKRPMNGTFRIDLGEKQGNKRTLTCRRLSTNNFHEGLWVEFSKDVKERLKPLTKGPAGLDVRILSVLDLSSLPAGATWPSYLRNAVNYRIGYGYGAAAGKSLPETVRAGKKLSGLALVDRLRSAETAGLKLQSAKLEPQVEIYTEYLLAVGSVLEELLVTYSTALWESSKLNFSSKWQSAREKYIRSLGVGVHPWP